jgi:hypothetical protein
MKDEFKKIVEDPTPIGIYYSKDENVTLQEI